MESKVEQQIKTSLERVQELDPHILMAVQHHNEKLICTAFLSEIIEGKSTVLHKREYSKELIKGNEKEAIIAFLAETSFIILSHT